MEDELGKTDREKLKKILEDFNKLSDKIDEFTKK